MFNLPNLPTDNLYKFKFLGGISVLVFTAYLYSTQFSNTLSKVLDANIEIKKGVYQKDIFKRKSEQLDNEIKQYDDELKKIKFGKTDSIFDFESFKLDLINDKNYRDYLDFVFSHKNELLPTGQNHVKMEKLHEEMEATLKELDKITINAQVAIITSRYELYKLIVITILTFVLLIYGKNLTKEGYKQWYDLVQKPNDEKLKEEVEKLKAENNKDLA